MSLVKRNIIANLLGSGWVAIISIVFIPFYIHFMGVEAYGLVGFYLTLQAVFAVLDMGLTATVSREMARLSAARDSIVEMRNMMRTLEFIYWGMALFILSFVILLSPWIATQWLNASVLPDEMVQQSIVLMGIMIALRMPYGFYSGALLGLQQQVLLNVIKVIIETLRSGGVVLVLWWVATDIVSFFIWQLLISALGLLVMLVAVWKTIPSSAGEGASFQMEILGNLWRFAAGMGLVSMLSAILVQMDKVILSKMLSLDSFAYYSLASTLSVGLYVIVGAIYSSAYPRFTQLLASDEMHNLKNIYHKSCQLMTVLVMPLALVMSFFASDILLLWTQNSVVTQQTAPVLSILVIGTALNGMMSLPFALQIAHGWTRLAVNMNIGAVLLLLPSLIFAVDYAGVVGAASIWLILNAGYIIFGLWLMHRRIFKDELKQWLITDFGLPSLVSVTVVAVFWEFLPGQFSVAGFIFWVFLTTVVAIIASFWAAPALRKLFLTRLNILSGS
jgi:O-antigen/teichoic acid export membrane protein